MTTMIDGRNRNSIYILPIGIFGILTILFLYSLWRGPITLIPSTLIGHPAPLFSLPALPGATSGGVPVPGFSNDDLKGGVTIVNIFASWCAPCREEHPLLLKLSKDARVRIMGINYKDQPDNARRFLGSLGNPYEGIGMDPEGRAAIDWGVYGVPESFVINRNGEIIYKHVGPLTEDAMKGPINSAIEKALKSN
jgi:cytochrome c biogenesis protein CcmG/thiol:disulfide interchange protein DsbE